MVTDFLISQLRARDGEKWASAGADCLSAWVADLDFPVADPIRDAIRHRIDTDLGYPAWYGGTRQGEPLGQVFANRMHRRFGWSPAPENVRMFSDINQAIQVVTHFGTAPGDHIVLHSPACPPFVEVFEAMGRQPRLVPMRKTTSGWDLNIDRLSEELAHPQCTALFLVNPHNPTGRVFTPQEIQVIAGLAIEHDVLVIVDEVHAELVYEPHMHTPFAADQFGAVARTVTLSSGSKAFNLAGVRCAVAAIADPSIREAVDRHQGILFGQVSALAVAALHAAWTMSEDWLESVMATLSTNRATISEALPTEVQYTAPDATFLAWLDCGQLNLSGREPFEFFESEAGVKLFSGRAFGAECATYVRLNFGTYPEILAEILDRMHAAMTRR